MAKKRKKSGKIGRNDPCRCESGKKYKICCLTKVEEAAARSRVAAAEEAVKAAAEAAAAGGEDGHVHGPGCSHG